MFRIRRHSGIARKPIAIISKLSLARGHRFGQLVYETIASREAGGMSSDLGQSSKSDLLNGRYLCKGKTFKSALDGRIKERQRSEFGEGVYPEMGKDNQMRQ